MRCFVAVELSPTYQAALASACGPFTKAFPNVRWANPEQLHVTLKFLGDVGAEELPTIRTMIREAAEQVEPFELTLGPFGGFPDGRRPRVLWCGVNDESACCARWVAYAEPRFEELGFEFEERPFHAHITVARARTDAGASNLGKVLSKIESPPVPPLRVERIVLFESCLLPAGPKYKPVYSAALAGLGDLQPV